jgi:hypothetical protein
MKYPILYALGSRVAYLDNIIDDTASISRRINAEYTFSFEVYEKALKTEYLQIGNSVKISGQMFDIRYFEQNHDLDGEVRYAVDCEHVFYRLSKDDTETYYFEGTPAQILGNILTGTEFFAGTVDFTTSLQFIVNEAATKMGLVIALANHLGGEIEFSNDGFTINILDSIGANNGFEARFGKNLKGISKIIDGTKDPIQNSYTVDILSLKDSDEYKEKNFSSLETIGIGDTIRLKDSVIGLDITNRIVSMSMNPIRALNTKVEIANNINLITDKLTTIQKTAVVKDRVYNGIKISAENGFEAIRSDNKAKTVMNATEGVSIYGDTGSGLEKNFYVDLDGRIKARSIDILENGTFNGHISGGSIDIGTAFSVDSEGRVDASNINISGGSISISEDIFVGNCIYCNTGNSGDKGIFFKDNAGLFWNLYEENSYALKLANPSYMIRVESDVGILLTDSQEAAGVNIDFSTNEVNIFGNVLFTGSGSISGLYTASEGVHDHNGTTDTDGSHNHGISSGTYLAVVDEDLNIVGYTEWVQSGSHSHVLNINYCDSHQHTITR